MGKLAVRRGLTAVVVSVLSALWPGVAAAQPGSGPRETVDESFTATTPGSPTGVGYTGSYHAAGDPQGNPPYMRQMVFYPPAGMRFDTSVPDQCTATDIELEARGPAACPPGSVIGSGTTSGIVFAPLTGDALDRYQHHLDIVNDANEQIMLIQSEGYTVVRGKFRPDGSIEFDPPTCFPALPTGQCADDYVLQFGSTTTIPVYTRTSGGTTSSYATTPPSCPAEGYWQTTVQFTWADGSVDNVPTDQPCSPPAAQ